ncbi:MAG: hypothetical protein H8D43_04950 [Chloroflexi bacterium]|nr:hypothetical protein [Chloroflexota bacterium]
MSRTNRKAHYNLMPFLALPIELGFSWQEKALSLFHRATGAAFGLDDLVATLSTSVQQDVYRTITENLKLQSFTPRSFMLGRTLRHIHYDDESCRIATLAPLARGSWPTGTY